LQLNQEGKRVRKEKYVNEVIPSSIDDSLFDMTHQEIADELNIKREGISQIEKRAMKKVKAILKEKGLSLEDLIVEKNNDRPS
jgi:DNA-directed RNA polymerase sigma subunit (sigma70/sigma32)